MVHHIFKQLIGGALYRAPIPPNPRRILDFGTGTGIWAIELYVPSKASRFPYRRCDPRAAS